MLLTKPSRKRAPQTPSSIERENCLPTTPTSTERNRRSRSLRRWGSHSNLAGNGGAARAAALVLKEMDCKVTVLARDARKAQRFAGEFGFASDALSNAGTMQRRSPDQRDIRWHVSGYRRVVQYLPRRWIIAMYSTWSTIRWKRASCGKPGEEALSSAESRCLSLRRHGNSSCGRSTRRPHELMREIVLRQLAS